MKKYIVYIACCLVASSISAQINMPAASPKFELKGTVGLAEVKVVYSRPSAKGRKVVGNLIRNGEVWRTGANASTKISFSETVKINGNDLAAGEYALYTIFTEETATIIFNRNLKLWGAAGYNKSEDALRIEVPVKHPSSHYETFTISFSDFTRNSANFNMKWEHTKAMFKIEADVDSRVMADIKAQVIDADPTNMGVYYQAASYYLDTDRNPKLALKWITKGIKGSEKEQYWMYHLQAKLFAKVGKKKQASAAAVKSIELAKTAQNPDYVRLNEQLIASLKK